VYSYLYKAKIRIVSIYQSFPKEFFWDAPKRLFKGLQESSKRGIQSTES